MQIEAHDQPWILQELMEIVSAKLLENGYEEGPGLQLLDTGNLMNYTKGDSIVCVQFREAVEEDQSSLIVESENEIPELWTLWDSSLIDLGNKIKMRLLSFAHNQQKVKQGIV
jgi:hypothetical protein